MLLASDPSTFVDPFTNDGWGPSAEVVVEAERYPRVNRPYPAQVSGTRIGCQKLGGDPAFVDATAAHPRVLQMVEALVGGPVKRPHRNRGLYVNFPSTDEEASLGPHSDTMPAEVFGMVYLDDVPPNSGGTTIWPTSPQRLYPTLDAEHRCGFRPNPRYSPEFENILATVDPLEFVGSAGDVSTALRSTGSTA
jgi:hypothetical protein